MARRSPSPSRRSPSSFKPYSRATIFAFAKSVPFDERRRKVARHLMEHGGPFTVAEFAYGLSCSPATARRHLAALQRTGEVTAEGATRSRRFTFVATGD